MQVSEQGLALIRRFEGFSATPYRCPAGKLTVGYGHALRPGEPVPERLSKAQAEHYLAQDAARAAAAVNRYTSIQLNINQFDALASFVFNVGGGAYARSTLRKLVNLGWHGEVPAQLLRWTYAGNTLQPGLVARRKAEAELYIK